MLARQDFTPERVAAYSRLAAQFGDAKFLSEEEREKSRAEIMAQHVPGQDLWVFGYGSLMWNPAIQVDESLPAHVEGFSRSFCMRLMFGRGMPDNPGLMLCLVPGGACAGIAHRIAPEHVESESKILWMREMLSGAYIPTWVDIDLGARHVRGVTFVINMSHPRLSLPHRRRPRRRRRPRHLSRRPARPRARARRNPSTIAGSRHMKTINYADIAKHVGEEMGVSEWVQIDQDRVNKFADATGDHQWIHVDVERAKRELPTKGTIAHGYLTLSLIPMLAAKISRIDGVSRGINYGSNKVRFTNMVPTGSRVRAKSKLLAAEPKGPGMQLTNEITIEIEGQDRPACIAETISLVYP